MWLIVFLILRILLSTTAATESTSKGRKGFYVLDPDAFSQYLGDDFEWATKNIPFIDFPDDKDILTTYYYRWRLYRKHIRYTDDDGFLVTEFLPDVPWAGKHNTIPAAAGHHIMEGRWIHDEQILNDYIHFWTFPESSGSNPASYTNWIAHATWQRYLLNGNNTFVEGLLDGLVQLYRGTYLNKYLRPVSMHGEGGTKEVMCWFQIDGYDAMEVSISGDGCRPTIASAMYGEAEAIVNIAELMGNTTVASEFKAWQEFSRNVILDLHWNNATFAVIPIAHDSKIGPRASKSSTRKIISRLSKGTCDLSTVRRLNRTVGVRELLSFTPWYYDTLIPNDRTLQFSPMWEQLWNPMGFRAPFGLRTAEWRHPCYNYSYDHGDCWNGPSWPYETSRVLTAAANVLHNEQRKEVLGGNDVLITRDDYWSLLQQYAMQHTQTRAVNDTAQPMGSGHLFENLHPDRGYWNNRERMYWRDDPNKDMGDDYNHSTFIDLILSGLLGLRPQSDGSLHIHPLLPSFVTSFTVDHVKVQCDRILSLLWGGRSGFAVLLDGRVVAEQPTLDEPVIIRNPCASDNNGDIRQEHLDSQV